jgi:general stress protein 26
MRLDPNDHAAVQTRLWDQVETQHIGMLGTAGQHFQPMTAFVDRGDNTLWFFAYRGSEVVEAAGDGAPAMFVFQGKDLYACIRGRLRASEDRERLDRYWSPTVAAWYPEGKDDPRLTLLRLDADDAEVWITEAGPVRFAFEIAKANARHERPDLGGQARLDLH